MKKILEISALVMVGVLVWFPMKASFVHAEDGSSKNGQEVKNNGSHESESENDGEDEGENEIDEEGQRNDEHDILSAILADSQKIPAITLPAVDEKTILTYADVVNTLKSYDTAVSQISASAGVDAGSTNLTAGEKALLDSLLNKHHNQYDRLNNRINEVKAQLKQLEDLLSPLGTQPISASYGIKGLLVGELNNFRDIITGISEFDSLNSQILQEETD